MSETIAQSGNENYAVSVGTSAIVLIEGSGSNQSASGIPARGGSVDYPRQCHVHNNHASQVLYVGFGSDLSTSNGLTIPAGEYRVFLLHYSDEMWAIASGATTGTRVAVLHGKGNPA